jgi:hypothetical protein
MLIMSFTILCYPTYGRNIRDEAYPPDPKGWSWFPSFYLQVSTVLRYATMASNDSSTIQSRNLYGAGVDGHLGIILSKINVGLGGEYLKYYQITDPSDVGNSNTAGTNKNLYFLLGKNVGSLSFFGKYYFSSDYEFEYTNSSQKLGVLASPAPSYAFEMIYHLNGDVFVGINYTSIRYKEYSFESSTVALSEDSKSSLNSYGLSLGYIF